MSKKFLSGINVTGTATLNTVANAGLDTDKFLVLDAAGNIDYRTGAELKADIGADTVSRIQHEVKLGETMSIGTPVYVGVDLNSGTNMTVYKATNATEAGSSKTLGLIASSGITNDLVEVVTEGLLAGLNTSAATKGDPVWLGVNGALIFGLANKPVAPAHLVFLGIVTRVQSNNGEIFVKVQNGFEMNEIHNYLQGSVQNNEVIVYESATSLYKPKTIPTILGYIPVPDSRTITINGTTYDLSENRAWTITTDASARSILRYVATANQTTFTISGGYTPGLTDVYRNGIKLDNSTDFAATNGTTIVLTNGASVNDVIEVYRYQTAFLANNALRTVTEFIATAGQTTFNVTYNSGLVDVFYNGSKLVSTEYTAGNGTSIVLNFPCNVNDTLEVHAYSYQVGAFVGQSQLNGNGFVKVSGTTVTYDNSTYLTTSAAASTYLTTASAASTYFYKTGGTITSTDNGGIKIKQGGQISDSVGASNFYNGLVFENSSTTNAYSLGYSQGAKFSLNYFDSNSTYSRLLTVTNGGSFGFGVVTPLEGIHIGGSKHIAFTEGGFDSVRVHKIVHAHADASDANNYFSIQVSNGAGVTGEVMRLTGQKFVGIGNSIPERGLDIDLNGGGAALRIRKGSANMIFLGTGSSATAAGNENAILQMHHNGDERIRLYTEGNSWIKGGFFGIGTSTPTHLVSLYGATQADIKFQNAGATRAYIWSNSSELAFNSLTSNPIKFFINDVELVRLRADGFAQFGPNANTLIYSAGNSGTIYMYESGTARIYFEANGSVIFNNANGVMINNTTPVGRIHVAGALAISNNNQTFRRVLTTHGVTGNYTQVKVIFNKTNWGSVTYDIKLASAGGSYHTAGAYYSNPGFSSHINSISAGNGISVSLEAASPNGGTQGATWTFSGATMIHPSLTVDISCGNGYQIDPNDIIVQFI